MSDIRDKVTHALPLRTVDYGESDLVVTLLTEHFGKQSFFAPAARKSRRRFVGAFEPFRLIEVRFRERGPGRMGRLTDAQVIESFDDITGDLHHLYWGSLGMELAAELLSEHGDASPVFSTAVRYLSWLAHEKRGNWFVEVGSLRFLLVLLAHEGLMPALSRCVRTGTPLEQIEAPLFSDSQGGLLSEVAARPEDQARPVPKDALTLLSVISNGHFPQDRSIEKLRQARDIVVHLFLAILDKEPKSLRLLQTVWL